MEEWKGCLRGVVRTPGAFDQHITHRASCTAAPVGRCGFTAASRPSRVYRVLHCDSLAMAAPDSRSANCPINTDGLGTLHHGRVTLAHRIGWRRGTISPAVVSERRRRVEGEHDRSG